MNKFPPESRQFMRSVAEEIHGKRSRWLILLWIFCFVSAVWGLGGSAWRMATEGVGVLGVNNQVMWGWDIVHFVFWIGLGHAGTLISSVLLLTGQRWRNPIARGAELMTLCAVMCAAVFPVVHVGRLGMAWLASPLPTLSGIWPDMGSPLMWDVMAVSTYLLLSFSYWYMGLLPDLATLRDTCTGRKQWWYGLFALGWQGTSRQWEAYRKAGGLMAAILTALVVSVHSVVSFDFAVTGAPGWHQSLFPPYFVAGAIFSGMAMVQLILLIMKNVSTPLLRQALPDSLVDLCSRFVLALSCVMGVMYLWEYTALTAEGHDMSFTHAVDPVWVAMVVLNVLLPQLFWSRKLRGSTPVVILIDSGVLLGMWAERFWIVVSSRILSPFSFGKLSYLPSSVDVFMLLGSIGLFVALYMLFVRLTPFFSLPEMHAEMITQERRSHEISVD